MKNGNDTSKRIMEVALKLFSEKGYYSTTTKQIAEESNVNEVTIFRHFGNKANIFQEITEHYVVDTRADFILEEVDNLDFEAAMITISKRIYQLYIRSKRLYLLQMKLSDEEREIIKLKLSRHLIALLTTYFNDLKKQEKISGQSSLMAATLINSLLGAFTVELLGEHTVTDFSWMEIVEEHAKQFAALYQK
ncbi:MAG: TetR/AcrR family transcriptional regulator [Lachnospiraceae bacterium]|nr:TetR/AcrR family transcriptional regulator [Lachnospiraceae bacterium]